MKNPILLISIFVFLIILFTFTFGLYFGQALDKGMHDSGDWRVYIVTVSGVVVNVLEIILVVSKLGKTIQKSEKINQGK